MSRKGIASLWLQTGNPDAAGCFSQSGTRLLGRLPRVKDQRVGVFTQRKLKSIGGVSVSFNKFSQNANQARVRLGSLQYFSNAFSQTFTALAELNERVQTTLDASFGRADFGEI